MQTTKHVRHVAAAVALALACAGCKSEPPPVVPAAAPLERADAMPAAPHAVLAGADVLEIYALDPYPPRADGPPPGDLFHGWRIRGAAQLADEESIRALLALVYAGLEPSRGRRAGCFQPRHGIRARAGADVVDLVICYECITAEVHGPGDTRAHVITSQDVEPAVSQAFRDAGLSIAR